MSEREIASALHRLELLRKIRVRAVMLSVGLHPGQPPLLEYIFAHPDCTQREAAEELDVTAPSAAASLKRLEKAGLVRRTADPQDARCNRLRLTPEGEKRILRSREMMDALDREMTAGLSPESRALLKDMLDKMFDNLADESTRNLTICRLHNQAHSKNREEG